MLLCVIGEQMMAECGQCWASGHARTPRTLDFYSFTIRCNSLDVLGCLRLVSILTGCTNFEFMRVRIPFIFVAASNVLAVPSMSSVPT